MMTLNLAPRDEDTTIKRVGGNEQTRKHLENLGFVPGAVVKVVNEMSGNVIVNIKESRVAISKEMAAKILV